MVSVGYLVAAGAITLAALLAYAVTLARRRARARERFLDLAGRTPRRG